jgi:hypothetical protein
VAVFVALIGEEDSRFRLVELVLEVVGEKARTLS